MVSTFLPSMVVDINLKIRYIGVFDLSLFFFLSAGPSVPMLASRFPFCGVKC